jgi:hypothetical protein
MDVIFRYIVTLYLAGDWFMVIGYSLAGASMSTILLAHLAASAVALVARGGVDTLM